MTHCEEFLLDLPDFVSFLMDGLRDACAVRNITISGSGALEQEQAPEGCSVHE